MRTSELMLGDWVGYIASWYDEERPTKLVKDFETPAPVKVSFITPDCIQYDDGENTIEAADYELHPIPLTAEILEKNGFKKEGRYFIIEDDYYDVSIREITDSIWRVKYCNTEFSAFDCVMHIAFIHELQHALRLCGIDKEIVL